MTPLLAQRSRADRNFERLYRRHAADVYRYALAVLRNPTDAEDVTQTTFMNAYRAFSQGERPQRPKNWLIAIAHNVCRQRFRQASRRPSEVELNEDLAEAFVAEETVGVEDIQRALGQLAFNQRAALVMRELEGRSYAEIAQILDVSVAAVETLIFRARRALREQLEGTLTCNEAELAISKQSDGLLSRSEKGQLRAHLRECQSCATLARRLRAQRGAWKALAAVPLPGSLTGLFAGSTATTAAGVGMAAGAGVALKAATVVTVVAVAGGTAYEGKKLVIDKPSHSASSVTSSVPSARPYAPGQIKPDGTRATKPTTPPGLAKKGETVPVAKGLSSTELEHPTQSSRDQAPGQLKNAAQLHKTEHPNALVATIAATQTTDTPKKKPKHVVRHRRHVKKKPHVQPISGARHEPPPSPEQTGGATAQGNPHG